MIALLRKDAMWALPLLGIGVVALGILLGEMGFSSLWVFPRRSGDDLFVTALVMGGVLGITAMLFDALCSTVDYLDHRPMSRRKIHGARVITCAALLTVWLLQPLTLWAWEAIAGHEAKFGRISYFVDHARYQLVGWTTCAVALFSFSLPTSWLGRILSASALGTLVWAWIHTEASLGERMIEPQTYTILHIAATLVLTAASFWNVTRRPDGDRPMASSIRRTSGVVCVFGVTLGVAFGVAVIQDLWTKGVLRNYPMIEDAGGSAAPRLVRTEEAQGWRRIQVDADHRDIEPLVALDRTTSDNTRTFRPWLRGDDYGFDEPRFSSTSRHSFWGAFDAFHRETAGVVTVGWQSMHGRDCRFDQVGDYSRAGAAGPFGPNALMIRSSVARDCLWMLDDSQLWRLQRDGQAFERVALPSGKPLATLAELPQSTLLPNVGSGSVNVVLDTDGNCYELANTLVSVAKPSIDLDARTWAVLDLKPGGNARHYRVEQQDPLSFVVHWTPTAAADTATQPRDEFQHHYQPRTSEERGWAAAVFAASTLRAPALQAVSFFSANSTGRKSAGERPLFDPFCTGGNRWWLVLLTITVAAIAVLWTRRVLNKLAVPTERIRVWTVWGLLLGPAASVSALLIETPRAHARRPMPTPPPPRIRARTTTARTH